MATTNCTEQQIIATCLKKIATWDYLRRSTKGEVEDADGDRRSRQENSLERQRQALDAMAVPMQIQQAGFTEFEVINTYSDPGVSGTKIADRPGLQSLLADLRQHPARPKTLRVDHMNRLSRASQDETQELIRELKKYGVRWIITAAGMTFSLGDDSDVVSFIALAMFIWLSHEESATKSRAVANGMKVKAEQGHRVGAVAPYGLRRDKGRGLIPGDPEHIAVLRRIFTMYDEGHSTHSIAAALNAEGIPGPRGGLWFPETVGHILQQRAYVGTLQFGKTGAGRFHQISQNGTLVKITTDDFRDVLTADGRHVKRPPRTRNSKAAVVKENAFEAIIDPSLFERVQKRLANQKKTNRKPRANGYALSRILKCDHCGASLVAVTANKGEVRYRCPTAARNRGGECRRYSIAEHKILPIVMSLLDEEIDVLTAAAMTPKPPQAAPKTDRIAKEIERRRSKIDRWTRNMKDIDDFEVRQQTMEDIKSERASVEKLEAEQRAQDPDAEAAEAKWLKEWWTAARAQMTRTELPVESTIAKSNYPNTAAYVAAWGDSSFNAELSKRQINESLHLLGAEIRLRWTTRENAKRPHFDLDRGRFRLGQQSGELVTCDRSGKPDPGFFHSLCADRFTIASVVPPRMCGAVRRLQSNSGLHSGLCRTCRQNSQDR